MEKTKLLAQFKSLTTTEITALGKFLNSPFYNNNSSICRFFDFLKTECKKKKSKYVKESAYGFVFPNEAQFNLKKFRILSSDFSKLIEDFWVVRNALNNEFTKRLSLLQEYRARNLEKYFLRTFKDFLAFLEKQPLRDENYWRTMHLLLLENLEFVNSKENRANTEVWKKVLESFEISCFSSVIKMLCVSLSQESVSREKFEKEIYEYLLSYIKIKKYLLTNPSIAVYFYFYQAEQNSGEKYFQKMKQCIKEYFHCFSSMEIKHIYMLAINHCIKRHNGGEKVYLEQLVELNVDGLEKGILFNAGQISKFLYRNIVTCYLVLNQCEKSERFAKKYMDFLDPKYKEELFNLCFGKIKFYQKKYDEARILLSKFCTTDVLMDLDARCMMLKILFEENEFEIFEKKLKSAKIHLKRKGKDLENSRVQYFQGVFKAMNTLLKANYKISFDANILLSEINDFQIQADKDWFMCQLNKLNSKCTLSQEVEK